MTSTYALRDSATMLRRDLRHLQRYPGLSLYPIFMPVIFLLLFVYVFGGTLGNGITVGGGRSAFLNFLAPGLVVFTVAGAAQITAISVAKDMTEGIIARFKTMRIWRPAVLAGHVFSSLALTLISLAVTIATALLIGYRPARRRADLAVGCLWPDRQERRNGEQHAHVPAASAVPLKRLRARRLDARRLPVVRREPAIHADHRRRAQPARQPVRRQRRGQGDRVVPGDHRRQLRVGQVPLQPSTGQLGVGVGQASRGSGAEPRDEPAASG